jgi:hypothetical protein
MKTTSIALAAAVAMLAGQLAVSTSALAACGPGYKPVKHSSGNTVCVLDAVAGNGKLKLKAK